MNYIVSPFGRILGTVEQTAAGWVATSAATSRRRKPQPTLAEAVAHFEATAAGAWTVAAESEREARFAIQKTALRATPIVKPDVAPPASGGGKLATGFWPIAPHGFGGGHVEPACSSTSYHAIGSNRATNSQGARSLYSTRLLALRAMRNEVERDAAQKLMDIDRLIAEEEGHRE